MTEIHVLQKTPSPQKLLGSAVSVFSQSFQTDLAALQNPSRIQYFSSMADGTLWVPWITFTHPVGTSSSWPYHDAHVILLCPIICPNLVYSLASSASLHLEYSYHVVLFCPSHQKHTSIMELLNIWHMCTHLHVIWLFCVQSLIIFFVFTTIEENLKIKWKTIPKSLSTWLIVS